MVHSTEHLNVNCHAYRQGLSTTTTLIQIMDELYGAADDKKVSSLMATDQYSAFDCVRHELLIRKLKMYKIENKALQWITDYLSYRSQYVSIGRAASTMRAVSRGMPQGLVLGPLLYSVYTNDITESVRDQDCQDPAHQVQEKLFGEDCEKCWCLSNLC